MFVLSTLLSSLFLAGRAVAEYGPGYGSDYGSGSTDGPSAAAAAGTSNPVVAAAVAPSTSSATLSAAASQALPSTGLAPVHVKVSNKAGNLTFEPNDIKASVGSTIHFQFYPKNHSVVQSTFDQPCQPINNIMPNVTGMFSGFMPVAAGASDVPVYSVRVNDTKPIWFYCSQGKHCQAGMVGVINAPAGNKSRTLASFQALAKQAPANISPGERGASTPSQNASPSTVALTTTIVPHSSSTVSPSVNGNSTASSSATAAQVTTNAASGSVLAGTRQIVMSVGIAGLASVVGAILS